MKNFETELRGMAVLDSGTGEKLGSVSDAIINPIEGRLLGLAIRRSDKESRAIAIDKVRIGDDAIMASDRVMAPLDLSGEFSQAVMASEAIGANVVTEDGRLAGTIRSIHVQPDRMSIYYRVAGSTLQRVLGGGFYMSGNTPTAFSQDGKRMIVPSQVETGYGKKSLDEFSDSGDQLEPR